MRKITALLLLCALLLSAGCTSVVAEYESSVVGFYFDTVVTLSGYCEQETLKAALDSCEAYERMFSRTLEGSDVWRVNHANGLPVQVSSETIALLTLAKKISEASSGAFDVSIAPVVELWDFGAETPALPDAAALADAVSKVDYRRIELSENTVTLPADMRLDLGGIAKGYVCDRVAAQLRKAGVESALLDFGGNIATIGTKPGGVPWQIGIQDPDAPRESPLLRIGCIDGAVVTSGDYERYFELDGVRYFHILDTRSGLPARSGLRQFTVIGDDAALCDALSTACFALGADEGLALCARYGVQGVCVLDDGSILTTRDFHENSVIMFNQR